MKRVRLQTPTGDLVADLDLDIDLGKEKHAPMPEGLVYEKRTFFRAYEDAGIWLYREGWMFQVPKA